MTAPALCDWTESTRIRRLEHELTDAFHPGIVPEGAIHPERAAQAAAAAIVALVAGRPMSVTFAPGASYADTVRGRVNLDRTVLAGEHPFEVGLEHLVALAAHEGGHGRHTKRPSAKPGRLFHWIHNVLEDERVESLVARDRRLFAYPLQRARSDLLQVDPTADHMLAALFFLVRTPERMPPGLWSEHEEFLGRVIGILTPFPLKPREIVKAVWRIVALLPKEVREGKLPKLPVFICGCDAHPGTGVPFRALRDRSRRGCESPGVVERYPRVEWRDAPRDAVGYERVRREVTRDAARFAEGLFSLLPPRRVPRARRGRLDRKRLHTWSHDGRLFCAPGELDDRLALALIIDLSGSMRGDSERVAQRIAVAVAEGAALLPGVRLYVYGHTADTGVGASTDIVRFATPARGRVESLGKLPVRSNNRDAHALEVIGRDLEMREGARRAPRLGMVICDGLPEAQGFRGSAAFEATRRSLSWFEQVWGPQVLVLTRDAPAVRALMPGPYFQYEDGDPMPTLVKALAWKLRRAGA